MTKQDFFTTFGKRHQIYDVLKTSYLLRLEDVQFTTSWRRPIYVVLKTSNLRRLEDVLFTTSWRRLIYDVLKTSVNPLIWTKFHTYVLTSTAALKIIWRFQTIQNQKNNFFRRCKDVVATSIQRRKKEFFLILYCLKYSENFKCFSLS